MSHSHASEQIRLWFLNDESLYNLAKRWVTLGRRLRHTKDETAHNVLDQLRQSGIESTPDGIKFSITSIRYALKSF